jgi:hypothetical protein
MYRELPRPSEHDIPPSELVYPAVEHDVRTGSAVAMFKLFTLPALVGAAMASAMTPTLGLVGLVATAAFILWRAQRAKSSSWIIVRVEGGEAVLIAHADKRTKGRFRLADLDVTLDTKTIRRVQEGQSAVPAVRFLDSRVGPELDIARIVFVSGDGETVPLTEEHVAHMDAVEWFGKIRVFLRKHGWLPEDERNVADAS